MFRSFQFFLPAIVSLFSVAQATLSVGGPSERSYPLKPDPVLTPGEYCKNPYKRAREGFPLCERDVSEEAKRRVKDAYDLKYGTATAKMQGYSKGRGEVVIDHLIPLCLGGGNGISNLWPQHKDVGLKTTVIEGRVCDLLRAGKLPQKQAVELVVFVKRQPERLQAVWDQTLGLLRQYGIPDSWNR